MALQRRMWRRSQTDEDLLERLGWKVGEAHRVSKSRDRQGFVLYAVRNIDGPGSELPAAM